MNEYIFALDIGTRSVNGLLLEVNEKSYTLIDYESMEHEERAMLDGQIHDIVAVSSIIQKVKDKLEQRQNIKLHRVCVAAAGRALKTRRTTVTKAIDQQPLLDSEAISFLELSAVQKAQFDLAQEEKHVDHTIHYYCVGYSVLQYKLDHDVIGSLIDQQGDLAEVEIIATFLPKVVVESLLSALTRADLEMEALTLEPIAAINVLIPESMRRLNVALVDIGAGTSDIALTDEGTITAYGMVAKAGDEITEAISDHYLLDFNEAERVKRAVTENQVATIEDILGFETEVTFDQLAQDIKSAIEDLADAIATEIITLNKRSPKAVMLVGGGSLTPRLTYVLAKKLGLPENRVATRGTEAIKNLSTNVEIPTGPEFITPIGIAIAAKQSPVHYISVTVNGRAVRLFDMKQLTVGDSLLAAGVHIEKMYGRPGMAYMITFNNQTITLPGTHGEPPKVYLNGQPIQVEDSIKHGDELVVEKGNDGSEPVVTLEDITGRFEGYPVTFNQQRYTVKPICKINDSPASFDDDISDSDTITVKQFLTLNEFLHDHGIADTVKAKQKFGLYLDEDYLEIDDFSSQLLVNNKEARLTTLLKPHDTINYQPRKTVSVADLMEHLNLNLNRTLTVTFNDEPVTIEKQMSTISKDQHSLSLEDAIEPFSKISIKTNEDQAIIFQDVFRFVSLNITDLKGNVAILKNGAPATFLDPLTNDDNLEIKLKSKIK